MDLTQTPAPLAETSTLRGLRCAPPSAVVTIAVRFRGSATIESPARGYDQATAHLRPGSTTCAMLRLIGPRFTGKERDAESGNDYFGARYYASTMGRFLSPDWDSSPVAIPYADRTNPQSFNLYSYAGNNPLSRTDPDGHCTNGGQQKGFWWCLFNDSDQDADRARQQLAQYKNISINGKTPADAAKGLSNSQTVQLERSVFNYISSQAMSTPGMMIALAIVPGAAEDLVPAEAAAAESGSLANLNKSLASQEQMGQLAAGQGAPIAGAGTSTVLRDADRLAAQYGGSPADWQKVSSAHYTPAGSEGTTAGFETHAYQNVKTGQVVEMKTKINPN